MVYVSNVTQQAVLVHLRANQLEFSKLIKSVATGIKPDLSVVVSITGYKLASAVNLNRAIIKQIGTGTNLTATAKVFLTNIKGQINDIKSSLISLNNADKSTLSISQINYLMQLTRINSILENASFVNKKLFNGGLSLNGDPYTIQLSSAISNLIQIIIERLSTGDGSRLDLYQPGKDNVLFPIISTFSYATNSKSSIVKNALLPAIVNSIDGPTGTTVTLTNLAGGGFIKRLAKVINTALSIQKDNPNSEATAGQIMNTKAELNRVVNEVNFNLKTIFTLLNTTVNKSSIVTNAEIDQAHTAIKQAYLGANGTVGNVRIAAQNINIEAPLGSNQSLQLVYETFNNVIRTVAKGIYDINGVGDGIFTANKAKETINNSLDSITNTINIITSPYGNIETNIGRIKASVLLENATQILDSVISQIGGYEKILKNATSYLNDLVAEQNDAANNYLSTNYGEEIPKLIESVRKDKIAVIGLALAERAINSILEQLNQMAISST